MFWHSFTKRVHSIEWYFFPFKHAFVVDFHFTCNYFRLCRASKRIKKWKKTRLPSLYNYNCLHHRENSQLNIHWKKKTNQKIAHTRKFKCLIALQLKSTNNRKCLQSNYNWMGYRNMTCDSIKKNQQLIQPKNERIFFIFYIFRQLSSFAIICIGFCRCYTECNVYAKIECTKFLIRK